MTYASHNYDLVIHNNELVISHNYEMQKHFNMTCTCFHAIEQLNPDILTLQKCD